jgi:hypothetical protein
MSTAKPLPPEIALIMVTSLKEPYSSPLLGAPISDVLSAGHSGDPKISHRNLSPKPPKSPFFGGRPLRRRGQVPELVSHGSSLHALLRVYEGRQGQQLERRSPGWALGVVSGDQFSSVPDSVAKGAGQVGADRYPETADSRGKSEASPRLSSCSMRQTGSS